MSRQPPKCGHDARDTRHANTDQQRDRDDVPQRAIAIQEREVETVKAVVAPAVRAIEALGFVDLSWSPCIEMRSRRGGSLNAAVASAGVTRMVERSSGGSRISRSPAVRCGTPAYIRMTPEMHHATNTAPTAIPSHGCE